MATFTGNKIKDTYQSIVKAIDNLDAHKRNKLRKEFNRKR